MSTRPRWQSSARGLLIPGSLLIAAQIVGVISGGGNDSLAPPSAVFTAGWTALIDGTLLRTSRETLIVVLTGLSIGVSIGVPLGLLFGISATANRLSEFTVESIRPIPSVALIPVALLSFGLGYKMEIAIVAFSSTWPNLIMTRAAVAGIEPRLKEVARVLGFGPFARITKIILPAALPRIFVGFRLAAAVALIVAVTVEITANPYGLGYALMDAQQSLRPDLMLALLAWIGIVGWSLNKLLVAAQRRLFGAAAVVEEIR